MTNRRTFIQTAALATAGTTLLPWLASATEVENNNKKIKIKDNAVILFQGDSITDAGRDKALEKANDPKSLGNGYASLVAAQLLYNNRAKDIQVYNRGISGNKVYQLSDRWDADCLNLKPDVLSIMIGVNDFWHTLTGGYKGTVTTYKSDFIKLLQRTKDKLPDVQLIIAEPFAIKGVKAVDEKWYPAFDDYRHAATEVASQFNAAYIPLQKIFDTAQEKLPGSFWTGDGVHPALTGAQLMATAWLELFK